MDLIRAKLLLLICTLAIATGLPEDVTVYSLSAGDNTRFILERDGLTLEPGQ